ncbi:MAG TPA: hypothetical protein VID03_03335 [Acidimicrobiia bacterium]|jgi:hypothetical protein
MVEIPESLLRRSAEAKAKALGVPVEQVLAEMRGEAAPVEAPAAPAGIETPAAPESTEYLVPGTQTEPEGTTGTAAVPEESIGTVGAVAASGEAAAETEDELGGAGVATAVEAPPVETEEAAGAGGDGSDGGDGGGGSGGDGSSSNGDSGNGSAGNGSGGNGKAAIISPRPTVPAAGLPEGVRTQRLLTVVKARAIQQVKAEPTDKVNTWPHLMLSEFSALLAITAFLLVLSAILQAPLLDPANIFQTPNPSKAPWYFLGLQELLSYFDPQIAGVTVPTIVGLIGFMMIPYVDRNPSTKPSDRKFAVLLYTFFMAGAATLTIFGVLFRGRGFNWSYPWKDGVFFDDIKDWVSFE